MVTEEAGEAEDHDNVISGHGDGDYITRNDGLKGGWDDEKDNDDANLIRGPPIRLERQESAHVALHSYSVERGPFNRRWSSNVVRARITKLKRVDSRTRLRRGRQPQPTARTRNTVGTLIPHPLQKLFFLPHVQYPEHLIVLGLLLLG